MQRHERLEQDIKVALSSIITYEVKEPEVSGMISVTDVKLTPDQKYATVYVSIYGKKKNRSCSHIRKAGTDRLVKIYVRKGNYPIPCCKIRRRIFERTWIFRA